MTRCSTRCALALMVWFPFAAPAFPQAPAQKKRASPAKKEAPEQPTAGLTERQRAIHALNRLTFGPRPGDVDAVMAKGLDGWIEDQLHPESIDDSALNGRLGAFASTRMNPKKLAEAFPSDGVVRQVMAGKRPMPDDLGEKLVYSVIVTRIQQQEAAKVASANPNPNANANANASVSGNAPAIMAMDPAQASLSPQDRAREIAEKLLALPREQRLVALAALPAEQLINFPN